MSGYTVNAQLVDYIRNNLKPHYKVGMISNVGRSWVNDFFDEHQLHDLFDVVVLSNEEGITKPNPLIFERAIERMGVPAEESIFVDDIQENCDGAKAIGMKTILYQSHDQMKKEIEMLVGENNA